MTRTRAPLLVVVLAFTGSLFAAPGPVEATPAVSGISPPVVAWKKKKKKKVEETPPAKKGNGNGKDKKGDKTGTAAPPETGVPADEAGDSDAEPAAGAEKKKSQAERIGTGDVRGAKASGGSTLRQSSRMEFDARVVRGETAGSGAVILFERGPRQLATLTERRRIFLDATIAPILGHEAAASPRNQPKPAKAKKAAPPPAAEEPQPTSTETDK